MDNLKEKLLDALEKHDELWEWVKRLDDGIGTYEEVSKIAELAGDEVAKELTPYTEEHLEELMTAAHSLISDAGVVAQQNLNDAARIGLKPMTTKYPKAKVRGLMDELAQAEAEAIPDLLKNGVPTLTMSMVDDIVEYNADFQAKAGLAPVIVRTWSGSYPSHDTKHTDWCKSLAGTYEYGKEPKRVYARHKGCRCRVEYFPDKSAKGRITSLAKGEIDRDSVLWNTKAETLETRLRKANRKR